MSNSLVRRAGVAILAALLALCVANANANANARVMRGGQSRGAEHMSTHTLGKHPMCHTSRQQHDGLGSHLNLNLYMLK
jgi:hypothetical protein